MKTYHIIDLNERNVKEELKHYTFEKLKGYFEPNKNEFPELYEKWEETEDLDGLKEFLEFESAGMKVPYEFEEDELESLDKINKIKEMGVV